MIAAPWPALCANTSHFQEGLSAFDEKNYELAAIEFKASIDNDNSGTSGKFYYAACLYFLGRDNEAKELFLEIYRSERFSEWGASSASYIEAIELGIPAPEPEKDLMAYINLTCDSEDNITYDPIDIAGGEDTRTTGQLYVSYRPVIFGSRYLGISLNSYAAQYQKNSKYDLAGTSGDISFNSSLFEGSYFSCTWGKGVFTQKMSPYYNNDYLDARVMVSQNNGASWTSLYVNGSQSIYDTSTYEGYDGITSSVGIRQDLNPLMYILYEKRSYIARVSDFSNRSDEIEVGATSPAPFACKLTITARLVNKLYLYGDPLSPFDDARHDTSNTFDILLSREIIKNLTVGLKYTSILLRSNLEKTESSLGYGSYDDHIVSLSLSYKI